LFLVAAVAACHPSASVERTTPVANLQSYRTVGLSVRATAFASQGQAMMLEQALIADLQQKCQFDQIVRPGGAPVDVLVDLNITGSGRGGGGWVSSSSTAVIETLLVLSDGQSGELLGTARIKGKSSGMIINNAPPENEAIDVVAKTVANLLSKSGCSGPRVAKVVEPPPNTGGQGSGTVTTGEGSGTVGAGSGSGTPPPSDENRKQAEELNSKGTLALRSADTAGALASFQQAMQLVPDPRYEYNVCLAYEAAEQWDNATNACKQARTMNPEPRLVTKIDHRLDLLAHHQ
jgi:tetratricopeptide (TPR) repeat protein